MRPSLTDVHLYEVQMQCY